MTEIKFRRTIARQGKIRLITIPFTHLDEVKTDVIYEVTLKEVTV